METDYLSLALGLLGSILFIITCFSIKRSRILTFGVIGSVLFIGSYIAKSDITAAAIVLTAVTRNVLFMIEHNGLWKWLTRTRIILMMAILIIGTWLLTVGLSDWQWYKLLVLAAPLALLYGLSLDNILHLKILTMLNALCWLTYEALTGAYTIMIGEIFGLIMVLFAIIRVARKTKIPKVLL